MFRRIVSLLLLPCLLLTQSAGLYGHAHADLLLPGHDKRPHFHTQTVPTAHDARGNRARDHYHGHGGRHHHHDAFAVTTETDSHRTLLPESHSDHDSNAVYVTSVDAVVTGRCAPDVGADTSPLWATSALSNLGRLWPSPSRHPQKWRHPPPPGRACPLYLLHLTLLI